MKDTADETSEPIRPTLSDWQEESDRKRARSGDPTPQMPQSAVGGWWRRAIGRQGRRWLAGGSLATVLAAALIAAPHAWSATADQWIDHSYGADGVALFPGAGTNEPPRAVDNLGRALVVTSDDAFPPNVAMTRLGVDGTPDPTFGTAGAVMLPSIPGRIHTDAGGTITLAQIPESGEGVVVTRLTDAGVVDTQFGTNGEVAVLTGQHLDFITGVAERQDQSLVFALFDQTFAPTPTTFLVALSSSGALDSTWASSATVPGILPIAGASLADVAADGNTVVVAGYPDVEIPAQVIMRYTASGEPDPTFGSSGRTDVPAGLSVDGLLTMDGGPYYAGGEHATETFENALGVMRVMSDGTIDSTFGDQGVASGPASDCSPSARNVYLTPTGLYLVGRHSNCGASPVLVDRFNLAGDLDTTFGSAGELTIDQFAAEQVLAGGAVGSQPNGQLLIFLEGMVDESSTDLAIIRLAPSAEGPTEQTLTLSPSADTNVRSGHPDRNFGASDIMRVRSDGNNRALVRFDQSALSSVIGSGTVLSARLRLRITDNGNNWGSTGRTVDVHRLLRDWAEGNGTEADRGTGAGATWNCAGDSNVANQAKDCTGSTSWEMGQPNNPGVHPWAQTPTATTTITNGRTGIVEYDVTQDVISFLSGTYSDYGWLIKKTDEGQTGLVGFGTKESTAGAVLVVTFQQ